MTSHKTGILLLNFGGPQNIAEIKPFLYRLFVDPNVLVGIPTPFRQLVAFAIVQARSKESIRNYESIGGSSPQIQWTEKQAWALDVALGKSLTDYRIELGMLLTPPFIHSGLEKLQVWGADELVLLPLFPQFSTTTTGSCLNAVNKDLRKLHWSPRIIEIRSWCDHPPYLELLRSYINQALGATQKKVGGPVHVLFSAHSLPLKIVERGDPYPEETLRTVRGLITDLPTSHSLAFQSRTGRMPWLTPYIDDEIKALARKGVKGLIVVPISFVCDHIETLFELDQMYHQLAKDEGILAYHRVATFNADPKFGEVLSSVVKLHITQSCKNDRDAS